MHSLLHTQATAVMTGHTDHQPLEEGLSLDDSEDFDPSEYAESVIPPGILCRNTHVHVYMHVLKERLYSVKIRH